MNLLLTTGHDRAIEVCFWLCIYEPKNQASQEKRKSVFCL